MYWIAIHLPKLPLQVYLRGTASPEPLAVVEGRRLLAANEAAQAAGIRAGQGVPTARAVLPELCIKPRNPALEAAAREEVAGWLGQFSPQVTLAPPEGVLLEVGASLRLFGGLAALRRRLDAGLAELGYAAVTACAPTPLAAQLLAQASRRDSIAAPELATALADLPVGLLDLADDVLESLEAIGARRLGDCLKLPRAGLARRCGTALIRQLDRAHGLLPDPRSWFVPPTRFTARVELGWPAENVEPLLFVGRRLLAGLAGFLAARQAGIAGFRLVLEHEDQPPTALPIALAERSRDEARLFGVLKERLARLALAAPVRAVALAADDPQPLGHVSRGLFDEPGQGRESCARLLESLRARLGDEAVGGVRVVPAHRPEFAWAPAEPGVRQDTAALCGHRPLWLLEPPQALANGSRDGSLPAWHGPVALLAGPERIESGWWDGADGARDYYLAEGPGHELLWLFRDRKPPRQWYLHGLFS